MPWTVQQVVLPDGSGSWTVVDPRFEVVAPVDRFLAHLSVIDRSPETVRSYAFDLRDYFAFLDQVGVSWRSVRLEDLGRFVGLLRKSPLERAGRVARLPAALEHCGPVTINRKLSAVSSFHQFHQRHGVACHFLSTTVQSYGRGSWRPFLAHLGRTVRPRAELRLRAPKKAPRVLSSDQVAAILDACEHQRDRFLFALLAGTGLRIGEVLGLRHEDIDAPDCVIRVRARDNVNAARAKSGDRDVPVAPELVRIFVDYLFDEYGALDCDYVFVNLWAPPEGRPMTYAAVMDLVRRVRRRTGFHFTPHQFRHTYATELLRREVPSEVVQKLLGHASVSTTIDTYSHLEIRHVREALVSTGWLASSDPADEGRNEP